MPTGSTVQLTGFKEMGQRMRALDADLRTKIGYRAVARVQRQTRDDAIVNANAQGLIDSGALVRNIAIARIKTGSSLQFAYDVGVRHGTRKQQKQTKAAGKNVNDPWYWFLHEFGFHDRGGNEIAPRPFITPAFNKRQADGAEMMADTIRKGLEKAART